MTERLRNSERNREKAPVIIVPGWTESPELFEGVTRKLEEKGRSISVFEFDKIAHETDQQLESELKSASILQREAAALVRLVAQSGVPMDIVAHSKGAIVAALAASQRPELFHSLILVNPAGMVENDSLIKLVGRFARKSQDLLNKVFTGSLPRQRITGFYMGAAEQIRQNPGTIVKEALEIPYTNIVHLLRFVRSSGVKVGVVHSVDDHGFPMKMVQQGGITSKDVDGFMSANGVHDSVWLQTEEYNVTIEEFLETFSR